MTRTLCVPCAEQMKEAYTVKRKPQKSAKITCDLCGKRRYGQEYEVTPKAKK